MSDLCKVDADQEMKLCSHSTQFIHPDEIFDIKSKHNQTSNIQFINIANIYYLLLGLMMTTVCACQKLDLFNSVSVSNQLVYLHVILSITHL